MTGRSGPASHLNVAAMPDRIVPGGRADLLAVHVGRDVRPLENGRQVDPLLHRQIGQQRRGRFRPGLAGDAVPLPRTAHAERAGPIAHEDQKSPRAPSAAGQDVRVLPGSLPIHPGGQAHRVGAVQFGQRRQRDVAVRAGEPQRGSELARDPRHLCSSASPAGSTALAEYVAGAFVKTPPTEQAWVRLCA